MKVCGSKGRGLGAVMIAVGATLLLTMLDLLPGSVFIIALGLGFCGIYLHLGGRGSYGNVGFLIPGMVLLSIGLFALGREVTVSRAVGPGNFSLLLGAAFFAVCFLHTRTFRAAEHGTRFWPLYPAAGLSLFGVALLVQDAQWFSWESVQLINYLWVAALLGFGLWLVLGWRGRKGVDPGGSMRDDGGHQAARRVTQSGPGTADFADRPEERRG